MISKETIFTIITRFVVLLTSFALVVLTSKLWGDEGRGLVALIIADVSIIVILNNLTSGGTLIFHTPKLDKDKIFSIAFIGVVITSFIGAIVFSFIQGFEYFHFLLIIALLLSYTSIATSHWLGKKNITLYNLFILLPPVLIILFLLLQYFVLNKTGINIVFYSYIIAYGITSIAGLFIIILKSGFKFDFEIEVFKKIGLYGFKNELSYFIQFLNYRFSYFVISSLLGLSYLGVFSIAIAISEAIWVISKSISVIHYSNIINTNDLHKRIKMTEKSALNSLVISLAAIVVLYFIPESVFTFIFGNDFAEVKILTVYMFPGIIAISVSNIYGHYFSGVGKMRVLIIKSTLGLAVTTLLIFFLLDKYKLVGACITLNVAYITSSLFLFLKFIREKRIIANQN